MESVGETLHRFLILVLVVIPIALSVSLAGAGFWPDGRSARSIGLPWLRNGLPMTPVSGSVIPVAYDEIGRLAATFNNMIGRLDASFRQIRVNLPAMRRMS